MEQLSNIISLFTIIFLKTFKVALKEVVVDFSFTEGSLYRIKERIPDRMADKPTMKRPNLQLRIKAIDGNVRAASNPPTFTPVCFNPIAVPRSFFGNQYIIAFVVEVRRHPHPIPAKNIEIRPCVKLMIVEVNVTNKPIII